MKGTTCVRILGLSDNLVSFIYSPQVRLRFSDVGLVIGCGDLAYYYLEYVLNALNVPCFFVRGNHDKVVEYSLEGQRTHPAGGVDLHRRTKEYQGYLFAGIEGSIRYKPGPFQYTQSQMWYHVFNLVPKLFTNKLRYGRYLDVFISHSPAFGIQDRSDFPHQGIKAFRWLMRVFRPSYQFHGHIHLYRPDQPREARFGYTSILNTYNYIEIDLE